MIDILHADPISYGRFKQWSRPTLDNITSIPQGVILHPYESKIAAMLTSYYGSQSLDRTVESCGDGLPVKPLGWLMTKEIRMVLPFWPLPGKDSSFSAHQQAGDRNPNVRGLAGGVRRGNGFIICSRSGQYLVMPVMKSHRLLRMMGLIARCNPHLGIEQKVPYWQLRRSTNQYLICKAGQLVLLILVHLTRP